MIIVKVTYTVQQAFVQQNTENINIFIKELQELNMPGLQYMILSGKDECTFSHLSFYDNEQVQQQFLQLGSFMAFQKARDESGLVAAPVIETMTLVNAIREIF